MSGAQEAYRCWQCFSSDEPISPDDFLRNALDAFILHIYGGTKKMVVWTHHTHRNLHIYVHVCLKIPNSYLVLATVYPRSEKSCSYFSLDWTKAKQVGGSHIVITVFEPLAATCLSHSLPHWKHRRSCFVQSASSFGAAWLLFPCIAVSKHNRKYKGARTQGKT